MSASSGPSILTDGLVFHYDMSNTQKSWKGKPTVNYITNPTNEVIATASEFAVFQDLSPVFDTYGEGSYSITADIKTPKPGSITVYTASGGVEYNIGYFSAACEAYYKTFYFNNISVTRTDAGQTVSNLSFYGGYGSGLFPSIKNVQVEKNSFATPFVVGTRSSTQALLDLTGRNTITANSLTYASDGTFSFNGSSNYATIASGSNFTFGTGDFTLEAWYMPSVSYAASNGYIFDMGANGTRLQLYMNNLYFLLQSQVAQVTGPAGVGLNVNTWYHAVGTRVGSTLTLYLNGVSVGTGTSSANLSDAGGTIGEYGGFGPYYFNGQIPIIRVYKNKGLSAGEVQKNFNAQRTRYGI